MRKHATYPWGIYQFMRDCPPKPKPMDFSEKIEISDAAWKNW